MNLRTQRFRIFLSVLALAVLALMVRWIDRGNLTGIEFACFVALFLTMTAMAINNRINKVWNWALMAGMWTDAAILAWHHGKQMSMILYGVLAVIYVGSALWEWRDRKGAAASARSESQPSTRT